MTSVTVTSSPFQVSVDDAGTSVTVAANAAASHSHAASDITSGTLAVARGGTGVTSIPMVALDRLRPSRTRHTPSTLEQRPLGR